MDLEAPAPEQAIETLPEGWVEKIDASTGKKFYVNRQSKQKQWKRPSIVKLANELTAGFAEPGSPESPNNAVPTLSNSETSETDTPTRRTSSNKRASYSAKNPQTFVGSTNSSKPINTSDQIPSNDKSIATLHTSPPSDVFRTKHALKVSRVSFSDDASPERSMKASKLLRPMPPTKFDKLGVQDKQGFLHKQSKLLRLWNKKYFLLIEDRIYYFDKESQTHNLQSGKTFFISSSTSVRLLSDKSGFVLAINELFRNDGRKANEVQLLAKDKEDQEAWRDAIVSHAHILYKKLHSITSDYWEDGEASVSFWRALYSTPDFEQEPIDVRTLLFADAPATGQTVVPGEVVEVCQVVYQASNIALRLADDRGWLLQAHHADKRPLCQRIKGSFVKEDAEYQYPASCSRLGEWNVFAGPSALAQIDEKASLLPGSIIKTVCVWRADEDRDLELISDSEEVHSEPAFAKLEGRGLWVPLQNFYGETVLQKLRQF